MALLDLTYLAVVIAVIVCLFVLFLLVSECTSKWRRRCSKTYCALCLHGSDSFHQNTSQISPNMSSPLFDYSNAILESAGSTPPSPPFSPLRDPLLHWRPAPLSVNRSNVRGVSVDSGVQSPSPLLLPPSLTSPVVRSSIQGQDTSRISPCSTKRWLTHVPDSVALCGHRDILLYPCVSPDHSSQETSLQSEIEEDCLVLLDSERQIQHEYVPNIESRLNFSEDPLDFKVLPSSSPYRPGYFVSTCEDVVSPNHSISSPDAVSPPVETLSETRAHSEISSQPESLDWDNYMIGPWS